MQHDDAHNDHRQALADAVRSTFATGSARVRYGVDANPPDLADVDCGEGVANFRDRTSRVSYRFTPERVHPDVSDAGQIEQIISRDTMYLRFGGPDAGWDRMPLGDPAEFGSTGDAGGYLDLLAAPGEVTLSDTRDEIDGQPVRRYALVIEAPRSVLRKALAMASRKRAPKRFWLDAWVDAEGHVRRMAASNREPNPDGSLPCGTVRTTVEFDQLGSPVSVQVPQGL